jgi:hypothetical protein
MARIVTPAIRCQQAQRCRTREHAQTPHAWSSSVHQGQTGQPGGQVPFTGVTQCGPIMTGPTTSQHSISGMQHSVPQQNSDVGQAMPVHGGVPQVPLLQYGCAPPHLTSQAPQLLMSSV